MIPTYLPPLYHKIRRVTLYLLLAAIPGTGYMEGTPGLEHGGSPLSNPVTSGPTFYVDATGGSDANDGLTVSAAWQSLDRVNSPSVPSGATVLFKRGEAWRGQLLPRSGTARHPTLYGTWGTGAKPAILGSVNKSNKADWINGAGHWMDREDRNLWRCATTFETDVGNLIFNGATSVGFKKWLMKDLTAQGDYYYDRATKQLTLYSTANPGLVYRDIEVALRRDIVGQNNVSYVTYENLALKYGAAHGFGGTNNGFIIIRSCDISFIGGGDLFMDGSNIRYGNGVEFWANARDCLVEKCRIWEIYDTALTNQNTFEDVSQYNITYRNNVIWNCAYASFECWTEAPSTIMANIRFENNTCANAGEGWGRQRPVANGYHLEFTRTPGKISDIYVRNNIFYRATGGLWLQHSSQKDAALTLDYNCWHQADGNMVYVEQLGKTGTQTPLSSFQVYSDKDVHSQAADPLFVNVGAHDYHLQPGSPCVDAGLDVGIADDCDDRPRPVGHGFDIGAYELQARTVSLEGRFGKATISLDHPAVTSLWLREANGALSAKNVLSLHSPALGAWAVGAYSYVVDAEGVRFESRRSTAHHIRKTSGEVRISGVQLLSADGKAAPLTEDWEIAVTPAGELCWRIARRWHASFSGKFSGAPALFFNSRPTAVDSRGNQARGNAAGNGVITSLWYESGRLDGFWSRDYYADTGGWGAGFFTRNLCVTVKDPDAWAVCKLYTSFPLDVDLRVAAQGHLYRRGMYDQFSELGAVAVVGESFSVANPESMPAGRVETTGVTLGAAAKYDSGHQLIVSLPDAAVESALRRYYASLINGGVMNDPKLHDFGNETDGWRVGFTPSMVAFAMAAGAPAADPVSARPVSLAQAMREAIDMRLDSVTREGVFEWGLTNEPGKILVDNQVSLPLMADKYVLQTGDAASARRWFDKLELTMTTLTHAAEANGGLVGWSMDPNAKNPNWYFDAITAQGTLAYHNIFYYGALQAMARLAEVVGRPDRQTSYQALAERVKAEFNHRFWSETACGEGNPAYFDWMDGAGKGHGHFMSLVQYPAIVFGLASLDQAKKILDTADRRLPVLAKEFGYQGEGTLDLLWPVPGEFCVEGIRRDGFGKYQNGGMLLTWTYWEIVARAKAGDAAGAWERLRRFALRAARTNWFEGENSFTIDGQPYGWGSEPYLCDQITVPAALVDGILGVTMTWDHLTARPALPLGWKSAAAEIVWKGHRYHLRADGTAASILPQSVP